MIKLRRLIRTHLGIKVFLAFLSVIVVGAGALLVTAEIAMPMAFGRHMMAMAEQMGMAGGMPGTHSLAGDLFANFRQALVESLVVALAVASLVAIGLGLYISRRMVAPIQRMLVATENIAQGDYGERIDLGADPQHLDELDELESLGLGFNRMASALEATEKRRQELISNVAHELRTPLSTIMGYMEGLSDGVVPPEDTTYDLVYREASRLRNLVSDLQQLSRLEEGALRLDMRPVDVVEMADMAISVLRPQYQAKEVTLALEESGQVPKIQGDRDRLHQVMINLLGNALLYTPAGGRVTVAVSFDRDAVAITVSDEGIGIALEHLPHIFERFYRVDRSRSRTGGGTGIGLTVSRHIIAAHHGTLAATSPGEGRGSVFTMRLPLPEHGHQ